MRRRRCVVIEDVLYGVNLAVSLAVVYGAARLLSGYFQAPTAAGGVWIGYAVVIVLYVFFAKGLLVGRFRGNGIRITAGQFPEIYRIYRSQVEALALRREPALYCVQSGGVLNAFATRMTFRNYVVIFSEVLEAAYEEGEQAVAFVLAHELAHVKRAHMIRNFFLWPAALLLPLRLAYSRACEYTCDAMAGALTAGPGLAGLLILAAGRKLGPRVSVDAYLESSKRERGFWVWFSEFMSTHPRLPKRIGRLKVENLGDTGIEPVTPTV